MSKQRLRCAEETCRHPRERNEPGRWVNGPDGKRVWVCSACASSKVEASR